MRDILLQTSPREQRAHGQGGILEEAEATVATPGLPARKGLHLATDSSSSLVHALIFGKGVEKTPSLTSGSEIASKNLMDQSSRLCLTIQPGNGGHSLQDKDRRQPPPLHPQPSSPLGNPTTTPARVWSARPGSWQAPVVPRCSDGPGPPPTHHLRRSRPSPSPGAPHPPLHGNERSEKRT